MRYCWYVDYHENNVHGIFNTMEECKNDIIDSILPEEDYDICICEVVDVIPCEYRSIDIEDVLERMDDSLEASFDDQVFYIDNEDEARKELDEIMDKWIKKYVYSDSWFAGEVIKKTKVSELRNEQAMSML